MISIDLFFIYWVVAILIMYGIRYYNNNKDKCISSMMTDNSKSKFVQHITILAFAPLILPIGGLFLGIDYIINRKKNLLIKNIIHKQHKQKTTPELHIQEKLPKTDYLKISEVLGQAMVSGTFGLFDDTLCNDVELVLYANKTIKGKDLVSIYWSFWRERYVQTKEVLDFYVVFSGYNSHVCLKFGNMVAMFMLENGKVKKILLSPRILNAFIGFSLDDLLKFPINLSYAKAHKEDINGDSSTNYENRIPCLCCGLVSEKLEWNGFSINTGIHGYSGQYSICPICNRVIEFYPEVRYRYEEPQKDKEYSDDDVTKESSVKLELTGLRTFYAVQPLKNSKFIDSLPEDIMFGIDTTITSRLPEFGPCSAKQIAEECNWLLLSEIYDKDKELLEKIKECYNLAVKSGSSEALNNLGILAYNYEDQPETGINLIRTAISQGSKNAMQNYFTMLWTNEEYTKAINFLCDITEQKDTSLRCLWNMSILYYLGDKINHNFLKQDIGKVKTLLERIISREGAPSNEEEFKMFDMSRLFLQLVEDYNIYSEKGREFHQLLSNKTTKETYKKNKTEVFEILSELSLANEYSIGLRLASSSTNAIGDESSFYICTSSGEKDENFLKYIDVKPSPMAVWEAYLIKTSDTVMPVYWHGGYITRKYIFSKSDLKQITGKHGIKPLGGYDLSGISKEKLLNPYISIEKSDCNNTYLAEVYCTFWNDWKGLVREHVQIIIENNKVIKYENIGHLIIFPYDCGICF